MDDLDFLIARLDAIVPVPVPKCDYCGFPLDCDITLETIETWTDDTIDDFCEPNCRKTYAFHRGCKEREDYEFELGWNYGKEAY